jgi:hypothetical protein
MFSIKRGWLEAREVYNYFAPPADPKAPSLRLSDLHAVHQLASPEQY